MQQVVLHPEVVGRRLGEEMVLIHLETGRMYTLNDTGACIWEYLQQSGDLDEVRRNLQGEFAVAPETLDAELATFVTELEELSFLRRSDA